MAANAKIIFEVVFDSEKDLEAIEEKLGGVGEVASKTAREAAGLTTNFQGMEKALLKGLPPLESWSEGFKELNPELVEAVKNAANMGEQTEEASGFFQNAGKDLEQFAKGLLGVASIYAGGRWLIGMAKDSIEVARAAGVAEKAFDDWEESTAALQLATGSLLVRALEPLLKTLILAQDAVTELITIGDRVNTAIDEQGARLINTTGSYEEYTAGVKELAAQTSRTIVTQEEMNKMLAGGTTGRARAERSVVQLSEAQINAIITLRNLTGEERENVIARRENIFAIEQQIALQNLLVGSTSEVVLSAKEVAAAFRDQEAAFALTPRRINDANQPLVELADNFGDAARAADAFFGAIDRGIGSTVRGFIKDLEFLAAGGGELQAAAQGIAEMVGAGIIDEERAIEMLAPVFVQAELLQVRLGEITAEEAARNIEQTLGLEMNSVEATTLGIITLLGQIDGSTARATVITTFINLEAGVGSGGGDPDEEPPDEEPPTGPPPGVTQSPSGTFLTLDQPMFVDSVPITIVTNDPLKAADAVIDVLGKLGSS